MARHFGLEKQGYQNSLTGTTTDAYVSALDWNCEGFGEKTIVLKNTDGANSLDYQVLVRGEYDGQNATLFEETALAAADDVILQLSKTYARVLLQVKATTPGSQATYQIDHQGVP